MARFSEQFILQVQQATDIVELISQYVALKRRGREFLGLCPFHDDKKPSLNVSPTKQIFKCFACGAGGSSFNFLMLYEKLSFPEAVRTLAERANIPIPSQGAPHRATDGLGKTDLFKVTAFAMDHYRRQLHSPIGKRALEYVRRRGLSDESIDRFCLGYAADAWDNLLLTAIKSGYGKTQLVSAGLAARNESGQGCYDRFRNRLMFPIFDATGRVVAFGGRALASDERAKYLNSPETPLFDKSSMLFGLNWAREGIVSTRQAVVVEGYLDAIVPLQMGVTNVVATLGTALTEQHVRVVSRYADEVVLVFDADEAGEAATERALELFLTQQVQVRVATISPGKDPCDFCLSEGRQAFERLIADAPDALHYAWLRRREALKKAGTNLAGRRRAIEDFLRLVATSSAYGAIDEMRRGQLAQHIGHMLNVPPVELQQLMRRLTRRYRKGAGANRVEPARRNVLDNLAERHILEVLLNRPELFDIAAERLTPDDFVDSDFRAVAGVLWTLSADGRGDIEHLMASEAISDRGALLADLATAGEKRGNYEATLSGAIEAMLARRDRSELQEVKALGYTQDDILRRIQHRPASDQRRRPLIR
ncbi:MAG: DNA primase [Planctomycetes bacterium]|nr:DNA primase [Planctomycetota bacterium]